MALVHSFLALACCVLLMAASISGKAILPDLDYEAGHGIGSTKVQRQRQTADIYAFLLWQTGSPEFQPNSNSGPPADGAASAPSR